MDLSCRLGRWKSYASLLSTVVAVRGHLYFSNYCFFTRGFVVLTVTVSTVEQKTQLTLMPICVWHNTNARVSLMLGPTLPPSLPQAILFSPECCVNTFRFLQNNTQESLDSPSFRLCSCVQTKTICANLLEFS